MLVYVINRNVDSQRERELCWSLFAVCCCNRKDKNPSEDEMLRREEHQSSFGQSTGHPRQQAGPVHRANWDANSIPALSCVCRLSHLLLSARQVRKTESLSNTRVALFAITCYLKLLSTWCLARQDWIWNGMLRSRRPWIWTGALLSFIDSHF